jgi:hypothetical protein
LEATNVALEDRIRVLEEDNKILHQRVKAGDLNPHDGPQWNDPSTLYPPEPKTFARIDDYVMEPFDGPTSTRSSVPQAGRPPASGPVRNARTITANREQVAPYNNNVSAKLKAAISKRPGGGTFNDKVHTMVNSMDRFSSDFQNILTMAKEKQTKDRDVLERSIFQKEKDYVRLEAPPFPVADETPSDLKPTLIEWQRNPIGIPNPIRDNREGYMYLEDVDAYIWINRFIRLKKDPAYRIAMQNRLTEIFGVINRWHGLVSGHHMKNWTTSNLRDRNNVAVWPNFETMDDRTLARSLADYGCTPVVVTSRLEPYYTRVQSREIFSKALRVANNARKDLVERRANKSYERSLDIALATPNKYYVLQTTTEPSTAGNSEAPLMGSNHDEDVDMGTTINIAGPSIVTPAAHVAAPIPVPTGEIPADTPGAIVLASVTAASTQGVTATVTPVNHTSGDASGAPGSSIHSTPVSGTDVSLPSDTPGQGTETEGSGNIPSENHMETDIS